MATLIGDVFAESSRFHPIIRGGPPSLQHQRSHESHFPTRSVSRSRDRDVHSAHPTRPSAASPRRPPSAAAATASYRHPSQPLRSQEEGIPDAGAKALPSHQAAARFPSPPPSSSPSETSSDEARSQHASAAYIVTAPDQPAAGSSVTSSSSASSTSTDATVVAAPARPMPSPASDTGPPRDASVRAPPSAGASTALEHPDSPVPTQTTIRVRDLAHIQSLAKADLLTASGPGILDDPPLQQMRYEISGMPIGDVIEMVAALLTKITTTNDLQHDALNRNATHVKQAQAQVRGEEAGGESNMSPLSSSVLAFHGKNVPAITILSYLSRIHKYCPTTYEVFLSLLVYFDRMTERVNDMVMKSEEARRQQQQSGVVPSRKSPHGTADADTIMRDDNGDETDSDLADDDDADDYGGARGTGPSGQAGGSSTSATQATYFVVDSFNIHRLIIAGVTCASKFFSDVFYTNSRYAKVGGLPLAELNHLELQFLLLNDFRLAVPVEDLEAYATMLVEFYAREVVAQRSRPVVGME